MDGRGSRVPSAAGPGRRSPVRDRDGTDGPASRRPIRRGRDLDGTAGRGRDLDGTTVHGRDLDGTTARSRDLDGTAVRGRDLDGTAATDRVGRTDRVRGTGRTGTTGDTSPGAAGRTDGAGRLDGSRLGGSGRTGGRRPETGRPAGERPVPGRPGGSSTRDPSTSRPGRLAHRLRVATAVLSALVLALTGTAWVLYRDVTAGITTTDILGRGWNSGDQNILLVGVDSRTDAQGNPLPPEVLRELHSGADTGVLNSDTIMLLHVPEDGGAAVAFSIPRDSYVDIPGYRRDKINAAYPALKAVAADELVAGGLRDPARIEVESAQAGRRALVGAVEGLTGLTVDHYAELNLFGFHNLTTAIGGVDVCLRSAVDEKLSGARFASGAQTISGGDALAFVRQRHGLPEGDLSRIRRQQVFLAAVADKILSRGVLTDPSAFGALIDVVQKSVVIDSGWDLLAFAHQASQIAAGNLRFLTIPTRGAETNARGDVVLVDPDEVHTVIEQRIAEQEELARAARDAPPPPPPLTGVIAGRYVVDVRNGSVTPGLATAVGTHVRALGFIRGTVDNSDPTETSVVRYTGSDGDAADALAEQLGGIDVDSDGTVTPGHLLVVLGEDFHPATVQAAAPPPAPATGGITAAGVPCVD